MKGMRATAGIAGCLLFMSVALQAEPLQTQMGMNGDIEVDAVRASVRDDILTVVLAYRNTGQSDARVRYPVQDVYYIDNAENKKYHVLKDDKGDWIAAPVGRGQIGRGFPGGVSPIKIKADSKASVWFKFPAPPDGVTSVDLIVPDVIPFEELPISR